MIVFNFILNLEYVMTEKWSPVYPLFFFYNKRLLSRPICLSLFIFGPKEWELGYEKVTFTVYTVVDFRDEERIHDLLYDSKCMRE